VARYPVYLLVGVQHFLLDRFYLYEPAGYGAVDERAGAAVAVRVGVEVLLFLDELALGLETLDYGFVAVFYEQARVVAHLACEFTFTVYRADGGHARALEGLVVVLAEARRGVHDSRAVLGGDVVRLMHAEGAFCGQVGEVREERFVLRSHEIGALELFQDLDRCYIFIIRGQARFGQYVALGAVWGRVLHEDVVHVRSYGQRQV